MARFRLFLVALEFWPVLAAFVPVALAAAWLGLGRYLAAQNALLLRYKPTIDIIALTVGMASLIVGYFTLVAKIEELKRTSITYNEPRQARTKANGGVNLRRCAKPSDVDCPVVVAIPPNSKVDLFAEKRYYVETSGSRATWRKIRHDGHVGWVNEVLLWEIQPD